MFDHVVAVENNMAHGQICDIRAKHIIIAAGFGARDITGAPDDIVSAKWKRHSRFTYSVIKHQPLACWIHKQSQESFYALPVFDDYAVSHSFYQNDPLHNIFSAEEYNLQCQEKTNQIVKRRIPYLDPKPIAYENCVYCDSPLFGGHDGTNIIKDRWGHQWLLSVNTAEMAPAVVQMIIDNIDI